MTKYNATSPGGAWAKGVNQFLEELQTGSWWTQDKICLSFLKIIAQISGELVPARRDRLYAQEENRRWAFIEYFTKNGRQVLI
jgi:hypothetical protein